MHVRVAQTADVSMIAGVLSAAAAQLVARGQALWTISEVSEAAVLPHVRDGLYHLGTEAGDAVGVFRLQLQDPGFWPEMAEGTSAYLHKLAVLPDRQGQGYAHELLRHAVRLTREKRRRFLRLDCVAGRPSLRNVYESFGFRHHSQKQIGGSVFDRFEFDVAERMTSLLLLAAAVFACSSIPDLHARGSSYCSPQLCARPSAGGRLPGAMTSDTMTSPQPITTQCTLRAWLVAGCILSLVASVGGGLILALGLPQAAVTQPMWKFGQYMVATGLTNLVIYLGIHLSLRKLASDLSRRSP